MSVLSIRPAAECRWDVLALGEVMLRLDPGEGRISTAREFRVWEGGGEYNVARGLRRCFGLRAALVTALADNAVGRLIESSILQSGVELAVLRWAPYDGVGRTVRNGLNFTERGFGVRGAVGVSDRGHTAVSQLAPGDVDWESLFAAGIRWFHCGGVFAALSDSSAAIAEEAMSAARRHGTIVSYDLNYRPSLWQSLGGAERAAEVNRALVGHAHVLFGNEEDFSAGLGFALDTPDPEYRRLDTRAYDRLLSRVLENFPTVEVAAATLRRVHSATRNDWGSVCRTRSTFLVGRTYPDLEILDRVGGGDSFASGFIYALLSGYEAQVALAYGGAHGALAMTTPGDMSMASVAEVERLIAGAAARVQR